LKESVFWLLHHHLKSPIFLTLSSSSLYFPFLVYFFAFFSFFAPFLFATSSSSFFLSISFAFAI